jgi:hypothetical protein
MNIADLHPLAQITGIIMLGLVFIVLILSINDENWIDIFKKK